MGDGLHLIAGLIHPGNGHLKDMIYKDKRVFYHDFVLCRACIFSGKAMTLVKSFASSPAQRHDLVTNLEIAGPVM